MKKGEFITKNPDEFTVGLVNLIHDYIDVHGLPDALKEETMVEVSHAILSEYYFKVTISEQISMNHFKQPETRYCNDKAMVALMHGAKVLNDDHLGFTIRVEPNPYGIVEPGKHSVEMPEAKKPTTQRKPGVRKQKNTSDVNQKGARSSVKTSYKRQVPTRDHSN